MGSYRSTIDATAAANFPVFAGSEPRWVKRITDLRESAERRTADRKRAGDNSSRSTGANVHFS